MQGPAPPRVRPGAPPVGLGSGALVGAWLAAAGMAWLTTGAVQACSPPALAVGGLAAAAAGCFLAGARSGRSAAWASGVALVTALPLARWVSAGGMPYGQDLPLHAWAVWSVGDAMSRGDAWPLWLDTLGVGQPVLQFYGPLSYLLGGAFVKLGATPRDALLLLSWIATALGAWGAWHVLRREGAGPAAASLAATAFVLAPYRLLNLNYRFALGELFGLAALLPCWHFMHRLLREPGDRAALFGLVLTAAFIVVSHPLSAILAAVGAIPIAAHALWRSPAPGRSVAVGALAGLLAFGLSAFHSVPAFLARDRVQVDAQMPQDPSGYQAKALHAGQTLTRQRWDGRRRSWTLAEEHERRARGLSLQEVPHYLGWSLAVWLPLTLMAARRRDPSAAPWAASAVLSWLCTLAPIAFLMGHAPLFYPLQFPWRFLGPASLAAVAALALVHRHALARRPGLAILALGVLLFDAWPGLGGGSWVAWPGGADWEIHRSASPAPSCARGSGLAAAPADPAVLLAESDALPRFAPGKPPRTRATLPPRPARRAAPWSGPPTGDLPTRLRSLKLPPNVAGLDLALLHRAAPEYYARTVAQRLRIPAAQGDVAAMEALGAELVLPAKGEPAVARLDPWPRLFHVSGDRLAEVAATVARAAPTDIAIELPEGVPEGTIVFVEQDFPGWEARVDGGPWAPPASWLGLLAASVPADADRVEFRYRATPARQASAAGSLATAAGLAAAALILRRR